jgi:hypothetical protein
VKRMEGVRAGEGGKGFGFLPVRAGPRGERRGSCAEIWMSCQRASYEHGVRAEGNNLGSIEVVSPFSRFVSSRAPTGMGEGQYDILMIEAI